MERLSLALVAAIALTACAKQAMPPTTGLAPQHQPAARTSAPKTGDATSPVPIINGSVYQYDEASWATAPNPQPTATTLFTYTTHVPATWRGNRNVVDTRLTIAGDPTYEGNSYEYVMSMGSHQALQSVGFVSKSRTSRIKQIYQQPEIEVETPFQTGNTWNGGSSYTYAGHFGSSINREIWHDGGAYISDSEQTGSNPSRYDVTVESDGSAKTLTSVPHQKPQITIVGVPVKRNGKYMIPIRQGTGQQYMDDWYPGGAMPPSPLDVSKTTDRGNVALPASCKVPSSVATSGELIANVETQLDPSGLIGTYTYNTYYATGIGLVCSQSTIAESLYLLQAPKARLLSTYNYASSAALTSYTLGAAMLHAGMSGAMATAEAGLAAAVSTQRMQMRLAALRWRLAHR